MAWFWARIKKRSSQLGYLEGGFQILINELVNQIKKKKGKFLLNTEIKNIEEIKKRNNFDRIIFTVPNQTILKIIPSLPKNYQKRLKQVKMIGALNLILVLKEKYFIDQTYWLNINEKNFPFVAVVEHTNLVNTKHYNQNHLLYIGGYYPINHRHFKMSKKEILKEFLPYLKKINPGHQLKTTQTYLFKNQNSQPVIPLNYSKTKPALKTPIPNVFLANMQMVYPWDRGTNYAVELGEKISKEIIK